jgi:ribonuclease III
MSFEERLGHRFADPSLLAQALTHRSVTAEDAMILDNERLEFLGDAVLQLVITETLFNDYPNLSEGEMAKIRAALVSGPPLADVATSIGVGEQLQLSPGEERSGGREKPSMLANAMEALLGAIYLDSGMDAARRVIARLWAGRIAERARRPGVRDYKTRLQEVLAQTGRRPSYDIQSWGPDHERRFRATVSVDGDAVGTGEGRSKKAAEQEAARMALERIAQS